MYGLGVRISRIFEILRHFLFQGMGLTHMVMTYIPSDARYQNHEYIWFKWGISIVFKIFSNFLFLESGD
jgi:hypothetical protein